jgi:precorrin-6B methylase 2
MFESFMKDIREIITQHLASTAILAAVGASLDAQMRRATLDPKLQALIDDLFQALDLQNTIPDMNSAQLRHMLGEIRFITGLDSKLLFPGVSLSWNHSETALLQSGADVSAGFAEILKNKVAPLLDGLEQRLSGAASFLDVGVGAAGLSIAMARLWPALRIVGIDPWQPSLDLARQNVAEAGLSDRIELRHEAVERISDSEAFDLAWLPTAFLPEKIIPEACARIHRGLRTGQWLLLATVNPGTDPVAAAIARLRTVIWGGSVMTPAEVERLLEETGFSSVRTFPAPPGSPVQLIAARKARYTV